MKLFRTLSAVAVLTLASCQMVPGPVMIPTQGALTRQVTRVVERHDAYVNADEHLAPSERSTYLSQSSDLLSIVVGMPDGIPSSLLESKLYPVMMRHDGYVRVDLSLEPLVAETYLATTDGLRSLLKAAHYHEQP